MDESDIIRIFNQAWAELYCPPARLTLIKDDGNKQSPLSIVNGTVYLRPNIIPRGCNPEMFLLWYFRHELAHIHHCPYDIKTAYSLEKAAYDVTGDWNLAYIATHIFSDIQVNLNYLPMRFEELPYQIRLVGLENRTLIDKILGGVYAQINTALKPTNKMIADVGKEIFTIANLNKTWHTKVQMIAIILSRLKARYPRLFSRRRVDRAIREHIIRVREDLMPNSLKMFEETYGSIVDQNEAREFFKQWIKPRLTEREMQIEKRMREILKLQKSRSKKEKIGKGPGGLPEKIKTTKINDGVKPTEEFLGKEPHLPTSISKPYKKISQSMMREALWRRYWYRSRAEKVIMRYLSESPSQKPVWSVAKYPDEWYIEDDIETLDVEISLDEGPLIPEVTTLKWVEEQASYGQSIISGFVPSAITILDSSLSMSKIHEDAAVAAFIAHLSAVKAGGRTSTINFSTGYVSADWDNPADVKELTLSMSFDQFTVFPAYEVMRLVSSETGRCFITIITDGGWQNIDEAIPLLERIAEMGHKIFIFHLPGGRYEERIKLLKRSPHMKVYFIRKPEVDLQNLVLSEAMRTYKVFLA